MCFFLEEAKPIAILAMKKYLVILAVVAFASGAHADARLHGTWTAVAAENGALNGTMALNKDGTASLSPEGFDKALGVWKVSKDKKVLTLTLTDIGSSAMSYSFEKKRLVVTYDNGNKQPFERKQEEAK